MSGRSGNELDALKNQAAKFYRKGKISKSLELYQEVLRASGDDLTALLGGAECLDKLGEVGACVELYLSAVEVYATDGLLLKAISIVKQILRLDPNHTAAQKQLADLYSKKTGRAAQLMPSGKVPPPRPRLSPKEKGRGSATPERVPLRVEVPKIPLFSDLSKNAFIQLLRKMNVRHAAKGEVLVRQDEIGDCMFVLVSGRVEVSQTTSNGKPQSLAVLSDGAFFGEMALISELPRMATVTALEDVSLLVISRKVISEVSSQFPSVKHTIHKLYRMRLLDNLMSTSPIFEPLEADAKRQLIRKFQVRRLPPRMKILEEGQTADGLYIVLDGKVEVSVRQGGKRKVLTHLEAGGIFGEISLLNRKAVSASIKTSKKTTVFRLPRKSFTEVASAFPTVLSHVQSLAAHRLSENRQENGSHLSSSHASRLLLY